MKLYYIDSTIILLASAITGGVSISAFSSLPGIPIGITSSIIGLKFCEINVGIKMYRLVS